MLVTAEELLYGKDQVFDVEIPDGVLEPTLDKESSAPRLGRGKTIRLRPLSVGDVQLIAKASKNDEVLASVLMIQRSMVEPKLKQNQIAEMHGGLVRFLVDLINRISGLNTTDDETREIASSPLVQAFFVLAKEFHWTPEQVKQMTLGQILGYLEMINQSRKAS
jgi:hypothetical protein